MGTKELKNEFLRRKVISWVRDVNDLAAVAEEEQQIAHSALTEGLSSR